MEERPIEEVRRAGFRALVATLGRHDAERFMHDLDEDWSDAEKEREAAAEADEPLPPRTVEENHERIMSMRDQDDQASLL